MSPAGYVSVLRALKNPQWHNEGEVTQGQCWVCGDRSNEFTYGPVIVDELARQWGLNARQQLLFSQRESMWCATCRSSLRLRQLARALVLSYGPLLSSLKELVADKTFRKLEIAEINSCGVLHDVLAAHPKLHYSEYKGSKKVRSENLQALTYPDEMFDLVLTSDTFEHVPDYEQGFREVLRVLKPGGRHIFTIPVVLNRPTRRRVELHGRKLKQTMEPSYHGSGESDYLVSTEFGYDCIDMMRALGYNVQLFFVNPLDLQQVNCVFVTQKVK
jgi:SAM-dependent methyltransferase